MRLRVSKNAFQSGFGCAIITLFALAIPARATVDYVQNGSFETTSGPGQVDYNGQTLANWTNTDYSGSAVGYNFLYSATDFDNGTGVNGVDGNIQLWGPGNGPNNGLGPSPDGGNFLADDGAYEASAIEQTLNLTGFQAGDEYQLNFWWGGAQQYNFNGQTTEQWQVTLGGVTQDTAVLTDPSNGFTGWQYVTMDFSPTTANPVLSFLAVGTPISPSEPPFVLLDGVSLTQTPEPGSFALIGFGLLGAPMVYRMIRRRRTVKHASR